MSQLLQKIEYAVLTLCLTMMAIIAFFNVISRFFFDYSFAFTEEVTVNLFVLLTFMGASVGFHRKAHLGFSLLFHKLTPTYRVIMSAFVGLLTVIVFIILIYFGMKMCIYQMDMQQTTPALGWPQWVFSMALPVGSLFCLIRVVEGTLVEIRDIRKEKAGTV